MKLSYFTIIFCLAAAFTTHIYASETLSNWGVEEGRKILIVDPRGGFGNRLGALASAYALARLSNRVLVLNWSVLPKGNGLDGAEMPAKFDELFTNPVTSLKEVLSSSQSNHPLLSKEVFLDLFKSFGFTRQSFCEAIGFRPYKHHLVISGANYDEDIAKIVIKSNHEVIYLDTFVRDFTGVILDGKFYSKSVKDALFQNYKRFFSILQPVQTVRKAVSKFARNKFLHEKNKILVGVHYRSYSKEVGDSRFSGYKPYKGYSLFEDFVKTMNTLVEEKTKDGVAVEFFLATDNPHVIEPFKDRVNVPIHVFDHDKNKFGISRSNVRGQLGGLVDFYLLEHTSLIIGSYQSSFSELAALMTKTGIKVNIGPIVLHGWQKLLLATVNSNYYKQLKKPQLDLKEKSKDL